jgi:ABC-2 type transport system permease protein
MSEATVSDDDKNEKDNDAEGDDEEEERESSPPPKRASATPSASPAFTRSGSGAKNVWTIFKREFAAYLNTPAAYILICVTMMIVGGYFFLYEDGVWQQDRASMGRLLTFFPFFLCALSVPLFTMRTLSEEKRLGTIELLITMPVKDSEVILGKYFAALAMLSVQLLLLAAFPIVMFKFPWHMGAFDWGPFWAGLLGLFLMAAAGAAVGLAISSLTENQIVAFFITGAILAALYVVGPIVQSIDSLKGNVADFVAFFSFQSRYEPFARGIIDTRAIVFFLSIAVFGTLVAFRNLESRKWS